jgi:hypothetical protein
VLSKGEKEGESGGLQWKKGKNEKEKASGVRESNSSNSSSRSRGRREGGKKEDRQ